MRKELVFEHAGKVGKVANSGTPWALLYMGFMLLSKFTYALAMPMWAALLPLTIIGTILGLIIAGCAIFAVGCGCWLLAGIVAEVAARARRSARQKP